MKFPSKMSVIEVYMFVVCPCVLVTMFAVGLAKPIYDRAVEEREDMLAIEQIDNDLIAMSLSGRRKPLQSTRVAAAR